MDDLRAFYCHEGKRPSVLQSLGKARTDGLSDFFGKNFASQFFACGREGK